MKPELLTTLQWLTGGGAAVLAALLVSWLAENWKWFGGLTPNQKRAVMVALCVVLSLGAWAIVAYVPADALAALDAPFKVLFISILALLGTQVWHSCVNKKPNADTPQIP